MAWCEANQVDYVFGRPRNTRLRKIVTARTAEQWSAQPLYEKFYCARGEMENRIKLRPESCWS